MTKNKTAQQYLKALEPNMFAIAVLERESDLLEPEHWIEFQVFSSQYAVRLGYCAQGDFFIRQVVDIQMLDSTDGHLGTSLATAVNLAQPITSFKSNEDLVASVWKLFESKLWASRHPDVLSQKNKICNELLSYLQRAAQN